MRASVAALLLAFLLAAPALPGPLTLASDAEAQVPGRAQAGIQLAVNQSGITIASGGSSNTHFIAGNDSGITISVPILNYGAAYTTTTATPPLAVFAWFEPYMWNKLGDYGTYDANGVWKSHEKASNLTSIKGQCVTIPSLEGATQPAPSAGANAAPIPSSKTITITIPAARLPDQDGYFPSAGYSVAILVNRYPSPTGTSTDPAGTGDTRNLAFTGNGNCLTSQFKGVPQYGVGSTPTSPGTCATNTTSSGPDCQGGDNIGFAYFVKDAVWDLSIKDHPLTGDRVKPGVQFCRGVSQDADCVQENDDRTDMRLGDGFLYNVTRRRNDWACDNSGLMNSNLTMRAACQSATTQPTNYGDSPLSSVYFEANVTNEATPVEGATQANATWMDDIDHGACQQGGDSYSAPDDDNGATGYPAVDVSLRTVCERIQYNITARLFGPNLPAAGLDVTGQRLGSGFLPWGSSYLAPTNLTGLYGNYTVRVQIDPDGKIPEATRANNYYNLTFEVAWVDLATEIATTFDPTHFSADPLHPARYPAATSFDIPVHVSFSNLGPAEPTRFVGGTASRRPVNWSIWIDEKDSAHMQVGVDTTTIGVWGDKPLSVNTTFPATSNAAAATDTTPYYGPGKHTLYACIDCDPLNQTSYYSGDNRTWESNESNNLQVLDIYFENKGAPVVQATWGALAPRVSFNASHDGAQWSCVSTSGGCPYSAVRPHEDVNVTLNVSDADQTHLNVSFVFQLASNASVTKTYFPCPPGSGASTVQNCVYHAEDSTRYYAWITDFGFANASVRNESWTVFGNATNSGNHTATSSATSFRLTRWPLQSAPEKTIVYGLRNLSAEQAQGSNVAIFDDDNGNYSYATDSRYPYWLNVTEEMTGIKGQPNLTTNLGMRVDFPHNQTRYYNGTTPNYWTPQRHCNQVNPGGLPVDPTGNRDTTITCTDLGNFSSLGIESLRNDPGDLTGPGLPGRWNFTLFVTDKGGDVRSFNRTVFWIKSPPQLSNATFSSHSVDPGQSFVVHLNVSDEFGAASAFVNFSRQQPSPYNVSFALHDPVNGAQGKLVNVTFNNTIQTGLDSMFGVAGNYSAWFSAVDEFGHWANTTPEQFLVNDTEKPNLLVANVDHARQEVGLPVTFTLNATDATNMTAYLQVLRGSETIIPNATVNDTKLAMTRVSPGNFTYVAEFASEGSYVWNMWVEDSVGQRSDLRTGPLSISSNLGPRFDLATDLQHNLIDGQLYTRAQPTIQFTVYDFDGVSKDSIGLKINERDVAPDSIEPTTGDLAGKGWIVTYAVPPSQRFHHLDVVHVNLTAIDLSDDTLPEWDNFTFVVDDVPPVVRLLDFAPRFRSEDRNIWNVSLQTQFSLVADDNDNLPTGVDRIQYSIIGGGNNAATNLYAGAPFTIGSAPGIYTGPRVYQIQFWAVDSVGNENHTHDSITVYVDDLPPSLDPFGSLPQGRFINASFIDDRSGVDRALVWSSTNGGPYAPTALDFTAGVWSTVLPECKKGDVIGYYLQAWDRVNNTDTFGNASVPYSRYTCGNHVPEIKVTAPAEGSTIARVVDLTWTASDGDNDPLSFTVFYRAPGKSQFVELAKLTGDARKYALDSAKFADGQYTFRVTAGDGTFVALSETTVTILNRGSPIGPIGQVPGEVTPGNGVLLTVQITKAQAVVEAHVFRDGKFVASYPMNDEGKNGDVVANDGTYSVRVAFDQAGDYTVDWAVHYQEDGQTKDQTFQDQVHFAVKLTPNAIFQQYGVFLVLVGLLAVAGIGVAAFVLLRRR